MLVGLTVLLLKRYTNELGEFRMKFNNTPLGMALAVGMGAVALTSNVGAVNLATDGIGDVSIAPYYTTRNNWSTLLNLTNTRPFPIAVKVRIHEGMNSRDVLDFIVALSANDAWTAQIMDDPATGNPIVNIQDSDTCVVAPTIPSPSVSWGSRVTTTVASITQTAARPAWTACARATSSSS